MSVELIMRGIFVAVISMMVAWKVFTTYDWEIGTESEKTDGTGYSPFISSSLLPTILLLMVCFAICKYGVEKAAELTLSLCFGIFLHISLYYLLLVPLLPLLRKHITARACALLWMIPNYLYFTLHAGMQVYEPLWVIRAPGKLVWTLFFIWLAGFVLVMGYQIVSHLAFRSQLLKHAEPVTNSATLKMWKEELARVGIYSQGMKLVTSAETATPLSIGLFRFTTRVILPKRSYDPEELTLILRHEIVHISREDAWSKFFLLFCTAMCWFNPFMWISMRRCADDLELSCDETVLLKADKATRHRYASLILNTAGNERGFTTCLSASATALRYRLGSIMKPKKQASGALVMLVVVFVLFMSCGYVALAYDSTTGAEVLYQSEALEESVLRRISLEAEDSGVRLECTDLNALHEYLANLELETITGNFSGYSKGQQLKLSYDVSGKALYHIVLSDSFLKIEGNYLRYYETSYYYLPEGLDWEYLDTLLCEKSSSD